MQTRQARCCIAGGGPAGIVLGYLLARAGVEVVVLEKWPDFFRDFRGDTIHPSTMTILKELGLLKEFLALPHEETRVLGARVGEETYTIADFSRTRLATPFIAFMPQWDFLHFVAQKAQAYKSFTLLMETEATGLLKEGGRTVGVRARHRGAELEIRAELLVGADGRHSTVREAAGIVAREFGAPMDVLWFRLSRLADDPEETLGSIGPGHFMVMIERASYWQCGFVIPKGGFERVKGEGLERLRERILELAPFLGERVMEIKTWEDVKFLAVAVDRVTGWARPGLLLIGDAAHAMSPVGGVGINLAVQDAVAAANVLVPAFDKGAPTLPELRAVERRRRFAVRATQRLQRIVQKQIIGTVLASSTLPKVPPFLRLLRRFPFLTGLPAYAVGIGFRPEHVAPEILESR